MTGVPWMNLGVDVFSRYVTPASYQPGMGLRPGHERPEIQQLMPALFAAVYDSNLNLLVPEAVLKFFAWLDTLDLPLYEFIWTVGAPQ